MGKDPGFWERLKAGEERDDRDEMAGWHHQLNGHEFAQSLGDGEGQGSLACCSLWDYKELDTTDRLNNQSLKELSNRSLMFFC